MSPKLIHRDKDRDTSKMSAFTALDMSSISSVPRPFSDCLTFTTGSDKTGTSVMVRFIHVILRLQRVRGMVLLNSWVLS